MDELQVQVSDLEKSDSNANIDRTSVEVEMSGTRDPVNDTANSGPTAPSEHSEATLAVLEDTTLPDAQPVAESPTPAKEIAGRKFLDLLESPIVEIVVRRDDSEIVLAAHQNLLLESPFLAEFVNNFEPSGPRRINLSGENVEALVCFLQFQYTRDYTVPPAEIPSEGIDSSGKQLLQHAHVYTLAEKLGLPALKNLAHTKIHLIKGTPSGELAYARYVYTHTSKNDTAIRKPIASFWATRGHVLRHELKEEWKKLCFEMPDFMFDVLTIVLDRKEKEKTGQSEAQSSGRDSARKRPRSGV
ncbi:uncharacterized protein N7498_000402 [Penicillium cinerascens]|uniref:BTB domain-containing protein n=1 Tax=Penicillium cinerascens TaxID=70096 RepID=A0A9W9NGS9_9EURO|nr:uncharacterized protein N7498_000402 [Penicillium cinerascens]KAJ5218303.1 hypothetical protein N7498_000402 [Penicillium cinerascens]